MTKNERLLNFFILINGAPAFAVCFLFGIMFAGTTVIWFATAPFVSDRLEFQIQRPILPAAGGLALGLTWLTATTLAYGKWYKSEEFEILDSPSSPSSTASTEHTRERDEAPQQALQSYQEEEEDFEAWLERRYEERQQAFEIWPERRYEERQQAFEIWPEQATVTTACQNCKHYHGQIYNNTLFVCAMHPYGCDSEICPDWES
jgi:hypothetical protein